MSAILAAACTPPQLADEAGIAAERAAADRLAAAGRHDEAAEAFLALVAGSSREASRQRYLILAARERLRAGDAGAASALLARLPPRIAEGNRLLRAVIAAEVALGTNDADAALSALRDAPANVDDAAQARLLELRGMALFAAGRPDWAVAALLEREAWLAGADELAANRRLIWEGLLAHGKAVTPAMASRAGDPMLAGWLELGRLRSAGDGFAFQAALPAWRANYPNHPASAVLADARAAAAPGVLAGHVALLVPLSGPQRAIGEALRDGFLAAWFATPATERPRVAVFDERRAGEAYRAAVEGGAGIVVGPLLKDSVAEVAALSGGRPVLALNYLEGAAPAGFYQFALSPEDEAGQVASDAAAAGRLRALALAPDNAWGRRMLESFRPALEQGGGRVLAAQRYEPRATDFTAELQQLLLVDESRARHRQLAANLGQALTFEPRRRADVDFIFLAASPEAGRLLRPQLKFLYAGDVPTYATSAIHVPLGGAEPDLEGIMFVDLPALIEPDAHAGALRETLARHWPAGTAQLARFHAMGHDAYRLASTVTAGPGMPEIGGLTGQLYMDTGGRVHRRLAWGRIGDGRPRPAGLR